jgi:hypothetical protein
LAAICPTRNGAPSSLLGADVLIAPVLTADSEGKYTIRYAR